MNWCAKPAVQKAIRALPAHEQIHSFLQTLGNKSLPTSDVVMKNKILQHAAMLEFVAGWKLVGILAYVAFWIRNQTVVDVSRRARPEFLRNSLRRLPSFHETLASHPVFRLNRLDPGIECPSDAGLLPNLNLAERFRCLDLSRDVAIGRLDLVVRKV